MDANVSAADFKSSAFGGTVSHLFHPAFPFILEMDTADLPLQALGDQVMQGVRREFGTKPAGADVGDAVPIGIASPGLGIENQVRPQAVSRSKPRAFPEENEARTSAQ